MCPIQVARFNGLQSMPRIASFLISLQQTTSFVQLVPLTPTTVIGEHDKPICVLGSETVILYILSTLATLGLLADATESQHARVVPLHGVEFVLAVEMASPGRETKAASDSNVTSFVIASILKRFSQ